ncbi:MAG: response regulator [Candidatus Accumulibacter sp.]|jgi:two-component system response regulator AlgR|nr:response regulator [Accumulibacter sp.]
MNALPTLSVMIVDDEAPARARLRDLLADVAAEAPNVLIAEAPDGRLAVEALKATVPDVMLVDIRMPGMDGIELAYHVAKLDEPPAIIFVTAYDDYAVRAFEIDAIDYLLKPVRAPRLAAALQKIRQGRRAAPRNFPELREGAPRTHLSCHERGRLLLIPVTDILYMKADFKYVTARTAEREYLLDESLTHLEQEFSERFIRLHRSVLVAREAIAGFEKCTEGAETQWQALLRGAPDKLPVSRRQWPLVKSYARRLSS